MQEQIITKIFKNQLLYSGFFFLSLFLTTSYSFGQNTNEDKEISHTIYVTANTGLDKKSVSTRILQQINEASQEDRDASVVLIGNITPKQGYPNEGEGRKEVENYLSENLMKPLEGFNGNIIYNPGVNEWKAKGHESIDDLESFLQDNSDSEFWPSDGCPIEGENLSDNVELVMVDSQWFLEDWDEHPYINNKCDYKTREQFFIEFKDELKDNQGKIIIVAVHHPVLSSTKLGFFNKIAGFSKQSYQNPAQQELRGRLETLASQFEDVIFVSGNDRNLQFLEDDGIPQIISGASAKTQRAKADEESHFASTKQGFAKLTIYKDQSSKVDFYESTPSGPEHLFSKIIKRERAKMEDVSYKSKEDFGSTYKASVYTKEETDKSGLYKSLWGDHYRDIYSRDIEVPVLFLDTLPGSPHAISEGGGHQSRSLRIIDDDEHEYTLREIRKSAVRFIQSSIKEHYVEDYIQNTVAERIVQDFYTTAHPYAPFAVNDLSTSLGVLHANPKLYYVPKQKNLRIYNEDYGDKLYMLEEHVGDENKEFETFGSPDDILSTADLLLELRETKKSYVDEPEYIKARLFDMLIGDWDRHEDQWRWAEYEEDNDYKRYEPIPRDRDQAFPKYDGPIIDLLQLGMPEMRAMQSYDEEIKDAKWLNTAAYPLDKAFIKSSDWDEWEKQVKFIQKNLTDEEIDAAFAALPKDTQDESFVHIRKTLKGRRDNLMNIARKYYDYLMKFDVITGTEEDDEFLITRKDNGITNIKMKGGDDSEFERDYTSENTKEIWIYGLDGDDKFKIEGDGNNLIKLKVMGGEEHDIYDFENKRQAKLYDYKSKDNTIKGHPKKFLTDSYDINNYALRKKKYSKNVFLPSIGFDPDAGFKVGLKDTYTTYGLVKNPFTAQHTFGANFYFATTGISLEYYGEFAHIFYNWNFGINARYTSPNYTLNYFGTGNDSSYDPNEVDMDFNRVRIQQWRVAPSLIWRNDRGSSFYIKPMLESLEVAYDQNEFAGQTLGEDNDVFESQLYGGGEINYSYENRDNPAFPSRGLDFNLTTGYKTNIDDHENQFAYLKPSLAIDYPLHPSGLVVLATKIGSEFIFGDDYEFYHAATLGGNHSLRGYRDQRFNGKTSFFQSTDLRFGITKFRTNFIPIRMGGSLGFDYGRVWTDNDDSNDWHTDYGGSVFINGFNALTANFGYYVGEDDNRFMFSLGFNF
ncbi:metallophosphatase [Salegentibacter chungangensis]|uniref:Metallophosphatase n=1 Tax=Salegentibacter chungangensis TaxID=1335724 RepID=A0ABW3NM60_9FLAO